MGGACAPAKCKADSADLGLCNVGHDGTLSIKKIKADTAKVMMDKEKCVINCDSESAKWDDGKGTGNGPKKGPNFSYCLKQYEKQLLAKLNVEQCGVCFDVKNFKGDELKEWHGKINETCIPKQKETVKECEENTTLAIDQKMKECHANAMLNETETLKKCNKNETAAINRLIKECDENITAALLVYKYRMITFEDCKPRCLNGTAFDGETQKYAKRKKYVKLPVEKQISPVSMSHQIILKLVTHFVMRHALILVSGKKMTGLN